MKVQLNLFYLFISLVSFMVGTLTLTGYIQTIIRFEDVLGEIFLCVMAYLMSMFTAGACIEYRKKQ